MKFAYFLSCINESMTKEVDRSLERLKTDLASPWSSWKRALLRGSNLDYVSPDHFLVVNGRISPWRNS